MNNASMTDEIAMLTMNNASMTDEINRLKTQNMAMSGGIAELMTQQESRAAEVLMLEEKVLTIYNSQSWKFGHGVMKAVTKFVPRK